MVFALRAVIFSFSLLRCESLECNTSGACQDELPDKASMSLLQLSVQMNGHDNTGKREGKTSLPNSTSLWWHRLEGHSILSMRARAQLHNLPPVAWRAFEVIAEEKRQLLEKGSAQNAKPQGASVFEAVQVSLPLEPPILKHPRDEGPGEEDKNIVGLGALTKGSRSCVVYGIGIATNSDFEQQMQAHGCETHAFDCTVGTEAPAVAGKNFTFHQWCIGEQGNVSLKNNVYVQGDENKLKFKSLSETMAELGHTHVDLLKFDIEGFEWALFETELMAGSNLPEQLSFELHTEKANPAYVPVDNTKDKGYVQVNRLFKSLYDKGYRVTSKEINNGDPACAEFVAINVNSADA